MRANKILITTLIIATTSAPSFAIAKSPIHTQIFNKLKKIAFIENFLEPEKVEKFIALKQETPIIDNTTTILPQKEIIDTYSGIKFIIHPKLVSFSYLHAPDQLYHIMEADPKTFNLIQSGTYIIASDKKSVFIIHGKKYTLLNNFDTSKINVVLNETTREIESITDGVNNYNLSSNK